MTRFPYGTTLLLFLISLVFGLELATGLVDDDLMLLRIGGLSDNGQLHGQGWRLLSYAFLHGSILHMGICCLLLLYAGPPLERRIGTMRLLAVFVMASVLGGLALLAKGSFWPTLGTNIGASAGALGLLLAHVVMTRRAPAQP
jgi:rhomboid protease GluP